MLVAKLLTTVQELIETMPKPKAAGAAALPRIDVLIPAIEKDLPTLPHVIRAARAQVRHPIGEIVIVAPRKDAIVSLCREHGWRFVDENTVLPLTKKDIHYRSARWERSGWLFQQLLKLSGDKLCSADFFLVIDADTVLIRPHTFRSGGRTTFYTRSWTQPEYLRMHERLMGRKAAAPRSLVTHYMLFEKAKLRDMKRDIEMRHGMSWHRAILTKLNRSQQFGFSEYETYGNYVYSRNPAAVRLRPALNRALHDGVRSLTPERTRQLAAKHRSVSFHERKGYVRKAGASARRIEAPAGAGSARRTLGGSGRADDAGRTAFLRGGAAKRRPPAFAGPRLAACAAVRRGGGGRR